MDVEVLNHFLTVVREENISRAAERLHVTQPTLSRQMAALEEELGTQLFIRGKHLQLTDAGVLLRGRAEEVTQIIDKVRMEFKAGEELSGVVPSGTGGHREVRLCPHAGEGALGHPDAEGPSARRKAAHFQKGSPASAARHDEPRQCPEGTGRMVRRQNGAPRLHRDVQPHQ